MVGMQQVGLRHRFEQALLDGQNRLAGRQANPVGQSEQVGVDRDGGLPETDVQHHVGGLSADARQGFQGLPIVGNLAVVLLPPGRATGR